MHTVCCGAQRGEGGIRCSEKKKGPNGGNRSALIEIPVHLGRGWRRGGPAYAVMSRQLLENVHDIDAICNTPAPFNQWAK